MEAALTYGLALVGAPYSWWISGPLTNNSPAWAIKDKSEIPSKELIFEKGVFCAGIINLMLVSIGLSTPENFPYNGGTEAYGLKYKLDPFILENVRRGDAVYRPYTNVTDQGHIGIALGGPDDCLLQSFVESINTVYPGVNINYTVRESHCGYFYKYIIKREDLWN